MKKAMNNYIVDLTIGLAFILSAISGLAFLLPYEWLPISNAGIAVLLGLSLPVWNDIHTVSSLVMITGVAMHLVLHWQWMVAMTKKLLGLGKQAPRKAPAIITATRAEKANTNGNLSRRQFLTLGGGAALGMLLGWNLKGLGEDRSESSVITEEQPATLAETVSEQPESASANADSSLAEEATPLTPDVEVTAEAITTEPTEAASVVVEPTSTAVPEATPATVTKAFTCPKGLVNDPYPGRCRHYIDEDGSGYCDYSEV